MENALISRAPVFHGKDFACTLIGSISQNIRFKTLCRRVASRIALHLRLGIIMLWRASLARLLIQCLNEKRQLVEGSYGKKGAGRVWTESYYFPGLAVLLRSFIAHSSRYSRPSREG